MSPSESKDKDDKPKNPMPGNNDRNVKDLAANFEAVLEDGKPGWVALMKQQLDEYPGAKAFSLATIDQSTRPRARYVILRTSPVSPESNFLVITNDIRMRKGGQIGGNDRIEGVFWMEGSGVQFRISGEAVLIDQKAAQGKEDSSGNGQKVKETLQRLGAKGEERELAYWEKERQRLWKAQSGHLRASFARPAPGKPLSELGPGEGPGDWAETIKAEGETEEQKEVIARAKEVFSLIVISPDSFECVELHANPNKRNLWTKDANATGGWKVEGLCP